MADAQGSKFLLASTTVKLVSALVLPNSALLLVTVLEYNFSLIRVTRHQLFIQ